MIWITVTEAAGRLHDIQVEMIESIADADPIAPVSSKATIYVQSGALRHVKETRAQIKALIEKARKEQQS